MSASTSPKQRLAVKLARAAIAAAVFTAMPAVASPDHDHGNEAPAAVSGNAPKRQPDGSVFLPKAAQRQIAVRTVLAESKSLPRAIELSGRVVMDPNAGGRVQATQAGRIEAGPKGLPSLGQRVARGEVLAYVRPAIGALDRANQAAQAADLHAQLALAERRFDRLKQLEGSVPQKEIQSAQIEVDGLRQRVKAVGAGLAAREPLTAPVAGVISQSLAITGQVVDARELVFEIVDPSRLLIEATSHDAGLARQITDASIRIGDISVPLQLIGVGGTLREQALPVMFRTAGKQPVPLAVGQALTVTARTGAAVQGIPIPVAAIVKNPGNEDIVWVHTKAERFIPKTVTFVPLDGSTLAVTSGLEAGQRVVVQGATLLNQVR